MKIAICYDRVNKWGGAERVLLTLHEMFPDAPLYTSVYNPQTAGWAKVFPKIYTSFLQKYPFAKVHHDWYAILMPYVFEQFDFSEYDLVISVTSEAAKGIITKTQTKHIGICLTPTRYLWSGYEDYLNSGFKRFFTLPIVKYLRSWDKVVAYRPDKLVAISTEVKRRIKTYYDRDSEIVFPPVSINTKSGKTFNNIPKDFFLVVSRLVPYKKVDLVVKTFNRLNLPLVIIGKGSEGNKLKKLANKNIIILNNIKDDEGLAWFYKNCKAFILPQNEDFGITAVECQVFGKPVIAYKSGGALDTIIDGKTGIFFEKQNVDSLLNAVKTFHKTKFNAKLISQNAKRFNKEKFKKELYKIINK